jgi:hypothetical protein
MENSFISLPLDDKDNLLNLKGSLVNYCVANGPRLAHFNP